MFNIISALHYARRELTIGFVSELCHIPPETLGNTVIYGDTLKQLAVAGSC